MNFVFNFVLKQSSVFSRFKFIIIDHLLARGLIRFELLVLVSSMSKCANELYGDELCI